MNSAPEEQEMLTSVLAKTRRRAQEQAALRAATQNSQRMDTLAAVAPMLNNKGALQAALSAQKSQQGLAPVQMGNTGFMLPGDGSFVESPMYADEKEAARQSALLQTMERIKSQQLINQNNVDQRRDAANQRFALGSMMAEIARMRAEAAQAAATDKAERKAAEAAKGRTLPFGAIEKITKQQGLAESFVALANSFKDELSGTPGVAAWQNTLGKYQPLGLGKRFGDQSNWWQNYNDEKNLVRNALFGSALTKTEQDAFDRANINEGMAPPEIRRRLGQQAAAAQQAYEKIIKNLAANGYDVSGFASVPQVPSVPPGANTPRPAAQKPAAPKPAAANGDDKPRGGVDANTWKYMTPEERALFK
jgi:hypothetical protein